MKELFYFIVFPGFFFSLIAGGFLSWFDRKITARVQFRKGPPILQPFYDLIKLLYKETIVPKNSSIITFLAAPIFAACAATLASIFITLPGFSIHSGFNGDLIVIFYILAIPSIAYIIGGMSTGNPLAMKGASREMKLVLSYELAFMLILATILYKTGMSIKISDIISYQQVNGANIGNLSGILLFIAAIFCVQAKLGLVPFDSAEAETEITHGMFIEYSGTAYAFIKFTKYIMLFVLAAFIVILFMGGFNFIGIGILWSILKILSVVLLITLIRNTNPRVRIDQAMRFFFIWINLIVIIAFVLNYYGL